MIRVLHVVTIMNPNGLENRIMDIYRKIDRERIQFDFLVHRLEEGYFDKEICSLGGKIYHIKPVGVNYLSSLRTFFNLHNEYKIVHSHMNTLSTWVLKEAKKAGVPVRIAHSRTWGCESGIKSIFKYFSRLFINSYTTHKFACSYQAGVWLFGENGVLYPNFFKVIPNSIDIKKFCYRQSKRDELRMKLSLDKDTMAIVNVGRFAKQKNHNFLLKIFKAILVKNPNARLFLIGCGSLEKYIDKYIDKLGLKGYVVKLGSCSNVGDYLCAMDAFIFPSLFEGFGTVTIEAQCCGLPILASDTIPKETKVTYYQEFESLNTPPEMWAEHILNMVNKLDRNDGAKLVKAAGFDIEDTYLELENFYLDVSKTL